MYTYPKRNNFFPNLACFKRVLIHVFSFFIKKNVILSIKIYIKLRTLFIFQQKSRKDLVSVINTQDSTGGASNMCFTLAESLREYLEVNLFVYQNQRKLSWVHQIPEVKANFFTELIKEHAIKQGYIELSAFHSINLYGNSLFKFSRIIHLHNLHGEFFSPFLFNVLLKNKKVIWTLHDESFITGHCSCTLGCDRWKNSCGQCPNLSVYPPVVFDNTEKLSKIKREIIKQLNPVIVCPSFWLSERVNQVFPTLDFVRVIPNGVDLSIFKLQDKFSSRKKLGLSNSKNIVLFVAEFSTKNPFKGGEIIRELIRDEKNQDILFITVGGNDESENFNHQVIPYIKNQYDLALLYSASDILVYPTRADNLPLVVIESMACGTPVIASKIGGIPEIISHAEDGYLVGDYFDYKVFSSYIDAYFNSDEISKIKLTHNSNHKITEKFSKEKMVDSYKKLYEEFQ